MEFTMRISPDGKEIKMLYTDGFDFRKDGSIKVVRASEVKFDNEKQMWFVSEFYGSKDYGNFKVVSHPTGFIHRKDAIAYEISFLETRLQKDPNSVDAMFEEMEPINCP